MGSEESHPLKHHHKNPLKTHKIHGINWLHEDYCLTRVPYNASLDFPHNLELGNPPIREKDVTTSIASSYPIPSILIGLVQAIWGTITIYRARGDQIEQYGLAAFGLTVTPYAWMSVLNGIANALTPSYPSMYIIETPTLKQAEEEGKGFFYGKICIKLISSKSACELATTKASWKTKTFWKEISVNFFLGLVPLAIVGIITRFQTGNSTSDDDWVVNILWISGGIITGPFLFIREKTHWKGPSGSFVTATQFVILLYLIVVAIGGMIYVVASIYDFGICTLLHD